MNLNDKIKSVIAERNLTPSHFADEIGVQRSSISHILSGRNRPSLEIVQKIVNRFPDLSYEWLLDEPLGLRTASAPSETPTPPGLATSPSPLTGATSSPRRNPLHPRAIQPVQKLEPTASNMAASSTSLPTIEKILIFYSDKTFTEYTPS